ncbi:MAG: cupin domain-containing protein, partial [Clostridia bacterium]|nr:cupin domain-containing protein [Clostridia bacterium]
MANVEIHYFRFRKEARAEAIQPSVIPYYDLTMVLEGRLEYRVNNKRISLGEGDAILMPPGSKR